MSPSEFRTRPRLIRMSLAISFLAFIGAVFVAVFRQELVITFGMSERLLLAVILVLVLYAVTPVLMLYLRGDLSLDRFASSSYDEARVRTQELYENVRSLSRDIQQLQARVATPSGSAASKVDSEHILESLRQHVTQSLAKELEARVQSRLEEAEIASQAAARELLDATPRRLREEIDSLTRRGNVNLLIGMVTTAIAVSLLVYLVVSTSTIKFDTWPALLSHYIPRITTVVFIEVFSFFFLRLYRASLDEIKYYQNELTTYTAQRIALQAAETGDDKKARTSVICAIGGTDRNCTSYSAREAENAGKNEFKDVADLLEQCAKVAAAFVRRSGSQGSDD